MQNNFWDISANSRYRRRWGLGRLVEAGWAGGGFEQTVGGREVDGQAGRPETGTEKQAGPAVEQAG